jgi:hypothetical protein
MTGPTKRDLKRTLEELDPPEDTPRILEIHLARDVSVGSSSTPGDRGTTVRYRWDSTTEMYVPLEEDEDTDS